MCAPANVEAAIGRLQRRNRDAAFAQQRHPCGVGAEYRPTAASKRQHDRVGEYVAFGIGMHEAQIAKLEKTLNTPTPELAAAQEKWERAQATGRTNCA